MLAWMALLASAADLYLGRLVGGSVLMIVIVKFGKSARAARTVDLRNFQKKVFFFLKKKCFVFSKKTFFLGEWNTGGPGAPVDR